MELHDFKPDGNVRVKTLAGESFMAINTWEQPDRVKLHDSTLQIEGAELTYTVPAHSIVLLTFSRQNEQH